MLRQNTKRVSKMYLLHVKRLIDGHQTADNFQRRCSAAYNFFIAPVTFFS